MASEKNMRFLLLFSIALVSMILITSQSPAAFAGAGVWEDKDNDGYSTEQGDCDDNDPEVYPGHGVCPTKIETDVSDNIVVGPDDVVVISNDATLTGNVEVNGGTLVITEGSTIIGNIGSTGGTIIIEDGSNLDGNIQIQVSGAGGVLEINDATIDGNIETVGIDTLTITISYITGNVSSTDDISVTITDNDVGKNITITSPNICTESGNTAKKNSGCP